jgi:hypothetical protein
LGNRHLMGRAQRLDMPLPLFSELVGNRSDLHFQKRPAIFFQRLPFPADLDVTPHALLRQPGPADLNGLSAHSGGGVVDDRGAEGR